MDATSNELEALEKIEWMQQLRMKYKQKKKSHKTRRKW